MHWAQNPAELHGRWIEEKCFQLFQEHKRPQMGWRAGVSCVPPSTVYVRAALVHEMGPEKAVGGLQQAGASLDMPAFETSASQGV